MNITRLLLIPLFALALIPAYAQQNAKGGGGKGGGGGGGDGGGAPAPSILTVVANYESDPQLLQILGTGLDDTTTTPVLTLGDIGQLTIDSAGATIIQALLPAEVSPGSYSLTVAHSGGSDTFDVTLGAAGPRGEPGIDGVNGIDGTNGVDGTNGTDGVDGTDGAPGLSAYQVWLNLGNSGTEADFIDSLRGPQGADGVSILFGQSCDTYVIGVDNLGQLICLAPAPEVIPVLADSYIRGAQYANDTYGLEADIYVKNTTWSQEFMRKAYFVFDLAGVSANLQQATLQLEQFAPMVNGDKILVYGITDNQDWDVANLGEGAMSYNNAPHNDTSSEYFTGEGSSDGSSVRLLGSFDSATTGIKEVDITPFIRWAIGMNPSYGAAPEDSDGKISIMLRGNIFTNQGFTAISSKQSISNNKPTIFINYE